MRVHMQVSLLILEGYQISRIPHRGMIRLDIDEALDSIPTSYDIDNPHLSPFEPNKSCITHVQSCIPQVNG